MGWTQEQNTQSPAGGRVDTPQARRARQLFIAAAISRSRRRVERATHTA